jgi:hypothetical protein
MEGAILRGLLGKGTACGLRGLEADMDSVGKELVEMSVYI